jgi:DNA polymerase I
MSDKPTLLLVDGSSYLYRAFHAMPDLRSAQGEPTGAIHGMIAMLRRLRDQFPAQHAACIFDAPGPTFRHDMYAEYKAQRSPMPEDLVLQINPIQEVVRLLGWPVLQVSGIEADDVMGTLARVAVQAGHQVVISTGDKDLAQLVNPDVMLINTMSQERLDIQGVIDKFGVPPERIIDYLSLMGDAVDNVPGVDKVGPKTACKWLAQYGSLQGVIDSASEIKGVVGDNLRKSLDWLPQALTLVTVRQDCDLKDHLSDWPKIDALIWQPEQAQPLLDFYERYSFKTWRRELERQVQSGTMASSSVPPEEAEFSPDLLESLPPQQEPVYASILTKQALQDLCQRLQTALEQKQLVALDTETNSLDEMVARLVGISFSFTPYEAYYVPLLHTAFGAQDQLPYETSIEMLKPWLEDPQALKVGQNIKYDIHVFHNADIQVQGYAHDTMLQSYVLEAHRPHGLENLAQRHLHRKGMSFEEVCGKGAQQITFDQVDIPRATHYACEDSDLTLHVHQTLWPQIEKDPKLRTIYESIEMPSCLALAKIERNGVLIDGDLLRAQSQTLGVRLHELEIEAIELAGQPFNLGSPKQIGEIFYDRLSMPVLKRTPSGNPSTDEEVLEKLAQDYPLPAKILEHRGLSKLKSTYTDKLPLMVNPKTGRVHTHYAQAVAVTGRLASNEPNLQNIPIRSVEGRRIREAFIAPPGHHIVSADYSQIELRIMAHLSGDPQLLKAFAEGIDVHRATASEIFGVAADQVSNEQRRYAKVINFGLIYGMSAFGLANSLNIERAAATAYIHRYFSKYPGVKHYMDNTRTQAKSQGYVETVLGRRLWLPEIKSPNGPRRAAAERAAINAPMQGTAADLIKLAMVAVQKTIEQQRRRSRIVMQVHDELVLEVPEDELEWVRKELPQHMAQVAQLDVQLLAEVGIGPNWDQAH